MGGEHFGLGALAGEAVGAGRGEAITLCPVVVVRGKEGCSLEVSQDGGSSLEDPHASMTMTPPPVEPKPVAPTAAPGLSPRTCKLLRAQERMVAQREHAASRSTSLAPSISSVLGKHSPPSPPPPTSPPPVFGSPVSVAVLDWRA